MKVELVENYAGECFIHVETSTRRTFEVHVATAFFPKERGRVINEYEALAKAFDQLAQQLRDADPNVDSSRK